MRFTGATYKHAYCHYKRQLSCSAHFHCLYTVLHFSAPHLGSLFTTSAVFPLTCVHTHPICFLFFSFFFALTTAHLQSMRKGFFCTEMSPCLDKMQETLVAGGTTEEQMDYCVFREQAGRHVLVLLSRLNKKKIPLR